MMTCRTQIDQARRKALEEEQKAESDKVKKLREKTPQEQQPDPGDSHVPADQSYPRSGW